MNVTNVSLENLGTVNKNKVTLETDQGNIVLYFSYETIVAVEAKGQLSVRQNDWSVTTGKFLNELEPNKDRRLPTPGFEGVLSQVFNS